MYFLWPSVTGRRWLASKGPRRYGSGANEACLVHEVSVLEASAAAIHQSRLPSKPAGHAELEAPAVGCCDLASSVSSAIRSQVPIFCISGNDKVLSKM